MILWVVVIVLAFLYFKGASVQAALNDNVKNSAPSSGQGAAGTGASQGVANNDTFNHLLDTITAVGNAYAASQTKTAPTTVEKH